MINKGFTIIEMIVALAVFSLVMGAGASILVSGIRAQRQNLATQEVLSQTSYVMEYMSRALRMAVKDDIKSGGVTRNCLSGNKVNYEFDDQCLRFRNYQNECQQFCWVGTKIKEIKDDSSNDLDLTSSNLNVLSFGVVLAGEYQADNLQPRITIFLDIKGREQSEIKIQTAVSQRNPDVRK